MTRSLRYLSLLALVLLSGSSLAFLVTDITGHEPDTRPRVLGAENSHLPELDKYLYYDQSGNLSEISAQGKARVTFCKIIIDETGTVLGQELPPGSRFSINIYRDPSPKYPQLPDTRGPVWKTLTFNPPYTLNRDLLYADGINDAYCAPTDVIEFDAESFDIVYDQEVISSNLNWAAPEYNDQFTHAITNLNDFFPYSNELFDNIPGNHGGRNKNSDGHVVLDPHSNRIVAILNKTSFSAPTPEPTVPVSTTPTITPTITPTVASPTTTPVASVTPLKATTKEILEIDSKNIVVSSDCTNSTLKVSGLQIKTTSKLTELAYSLNNGSSWNQLSLDTQAYSQLLAFESPRLSTDLYQLKVKTSSTAGLTNEVALGNYAHNCTGRVVILGNYYQNGFNHAFLDDQGNVLYNPALVLKLYAETLDPVDQLYLRLAESESALWTEPREILPMSYDFAAKLWFIELPAESIASALSYSGLSVSSEKDEQVFVKPIEPIINVETDSSTSPGYNYEIYTREAEAWHKLDYASELNAISDNAFQLFNLYPGYYYFKVTYPDAKTYYSEKFELSVPAVVQVQTTDTPKYKFLASLDHLLRNLEVEVVSKQQAPDAASLVSVSSDNDFELYHSLIQGTDLESKEKLVFVYWNRWNPYFDEQNNNYVDLDRLLTELSDRKDRLVLLTDPNSFDELTRTVLIRQIPATVVLVDNDYFLNHELRYQPELVVYARDAKQIYRLHGNDNLAELRIRLNALDYFSRESL